MRVLAFTLSYPPKRFIGSELMDHQLLKALQTAGHHVTVQTSLDEAAWIYDGIPVLGRKHHPKADVVLAHGDWGRPAREHRATHGTPVVMLGHNESLRVRAGLYESRPDLVVVNSHHMSNVLKRPGAMVVHPPSPPTDPAGGSAVTVLSLNELKGGHQFWDIVHAMPDTRFIAVMSGYGTQIVPERIPPNVELLEHRSPAEMRSIWSRTGAFLQLSASESWGMAAAEALAVGAHVIAHPTPGLRENLARAATWVDRDNTAAWVQAIRAPHDPGKSLRRAHRNYLLSRRQIRQFVTAISRLEQHGHLARHG